MRLKHWRSTTLRRLVLLRALEISPMPSGHCGGADLTLVRNDGMIGVDEIFGFGGQSCANCRQLFALEPHFYSTTFSFFLSLCRMLRLTSRRNSTRSTTRHGEDCVAQVQTWLYHEITLEWTLSRFPTLFSFPSPWTILTRAILGM